MTASANSRAPSPPFSQCLDSAQRAPAASAALRTMAHFGVGIGVEPVDADHRVDAGLADDADHVDHVLAALFHQFEVLLGVGFIHGFSGNDLGAAAMHFQGADGGGQYGDVGFQAGEAAFHVPEFLETDIGGKSGLGDVVVEALQADAVGDDGTLAHGDVGERAGVHEAGVVLGGAHEGRVDGVAHEGGHGVAHFQVAAGDRFAILEKATVMLLMRSFRSARSVATARMAITRSPRRCRTWTAW
jgi:hypothetical protein